MVVGDEGVDIIRILAIWDRTSLAAGGCPLLFVSEWYDGGGDTSSAAVGFAEVAGNVGASFNFVAVTVPTSS